MGCVVEGDSVPKRECYIDHICVDSAFRGKGIGKSLMETADNEARKRGCTVGINDTLYGSDGRI